MAADIGVAGGTVRQWRNRNSIPPEYWPAIINAAAQRGHSFDLSDFLAARLEGEAA